MVSNFRELLKSSFKSDDTEEWLDVHFNRPIGLCWALFFKKIHVHPNTVTVLSMILGAAAGVMFYYTDVVHNLLGVLLLMLANFYDSADGQLARITNQRTRLGRMLDGLGGDVWFYSIYLCVCLRLTPQYVPFTSIEWGVWIWLVAAFSGLICHSRQSALADYYRNIHLFFLKGTEGSELDNSVQQRELLASIPRKGNFWYHAFIWGYGNYCVGQERRTPEFQTFMAKVKSADASTYAYQQMRDEFLAGSRPLMKYTNILTFNVRAITLYISCLIDMPWIYFLVEIIIMNFLYVRMRSRHEQLCRGLRLKYLEKQNG